MFFCVVTVVMQKIPHKKDETCILDNLFVLAASVFSVFFISEDTTGFLTGPIALSSGLRHSLEGKIRPRHNGVPDLPYILQASHGRTWWQTLCTYFRYKKRAVF